MSLSIKKYVAPVLLFGILAILFVITLDLTIYFINRGPLPNDSDGKIKSEIVSSLLHILVVILIGGIVAALFKAYERQLEQSKVHTQVKLDFIKRIGELYRLAKKTRRCLKEEGIRINDANEQVILTRKQYEYYSKQMGIINDIQLEIEGFKIAAANSFLFPNSSEIAEHLWRMEDYLNEIHGEFEEMNPSLKDSETVDMNKLTWLREFTFHANNELLKKVVKNYSPKEAGNTTNYCFKTIFSNSYGKLLKDLR